jgi:hypothetical protein
MDITLSTFRLVLYIWIGIAIAIFFLLLKIKAPYGRHTSEKWGPLVDNHYGWMIMEFPALAVMMYTFILCFRLNSFVNEFMIGLFCLHYINRTFIFPFRLHTKGKKMPWLIVLSGVFFNAINTGSLGYYFTHFAAYPGSYVNDPKFLIGSFLFFTGMMINWSADNRLIHLRGPGETGYKIPLGGLFRYISCPNMFGELIEWGGFAILCWNLPALSFFAWSLANLLPRALAHHQWYKNEFADYPAERKAVIPFVL